MPNQSSIATRGLILPWREESGRLILPRLGREVFVAPGGAVVGDVELGDAVSVWFNTVLRGDVNSIRIGARTNLQDLTMCHVTHRKFALEVGEDVTVGHRATLHGCSVGDRCLIGMGATIMDNTTLGEECIVGAGALVTMGKTFAPRSMILGSPAKAVRELTKAEIDGLRESADHYVRVAQTYRTLGVGCAETAPAGGDLAGR